MSSEVTARCQCVPRATASSSYMRSQTWGRGWLTLDMLLVGFRDVDRGWNESQPLPFLRIANAIQAMVRFKSNCVGADCDQMSK